MHLGIEPVKPDCISRLRPPSEEAIDAMLRSPGTQILGFLGRFSFVGMQKRHLHATGQDITGGRRGGMPNTVRFG